MTNEKEEIEGVSYGLFSPAPINITCEPGDGISGSGGSLELAQEAIDWSKELPPLPPQGRIEVLMQGIRNKLGNNGGTTSILDGFCYYCGQSGDYFKVNEGGLCDLPSIARFSSNKIIIDQVMSDFRTLDQLAEFLQSCLDKITAEDKERVAQAKIDSIARLKSELALLEEVQS